MSKTRIPCSARFSSVHFKYFIVESLLGSLQQSVSSLPLPWVTNAYAITDQSLRVSAVLVMRLFDKFQCLPICPTVRVWMNKPRPPNLILKANCPVFSLFCFFTCTYLLAYYKALNKCPQVKGALRANHILRFYHLPKLQFYRPYAQY